MRCSHDTNLQDPRSLCQRLPREGASQRQCGRIRQLSVMLCSQTATQKEEKQRTTVEARAVRDNTLDGIGRRWSYSSERLTKESLLINHALECEQRRFFFGSATHVIFF
jgi:hypothetical protein